jgi:phospholipase A1
VRGILLLLVVALPAAAQDLGQWEQRIEDDARRESFTLTARQPNYVLVTHMSAPNPVPYEFIGSRDRLDHNEVKFQISLQTKVADDLFGTSGDLWLSYTQVAWWQIFNGAISNPFRETNYLPEARISFLTNVSVSGLRLREISGGILHQSNGRAEPLSRSWNRAFAEFQFARGEFGLSFKPWVRFKEDPQDDENPDITQYMGRYEITALYHWRGQTFSLMGRNLLDKEHRYNAELNWSFPIRHKLRGLVQWYKGYGESLIDYNYNMNRIGIGLMISDWM